MNANDFVSVEKILAEVTQTVNDKDFKNGFPKGWYISRIHDAIQELAIETFFFKVTMDFELPEKLQLPMPPDTFNIREIYLYNGERCAPAKTQVVYFKRLFNNKFTGEGYTAKVKDDGSNSADIFQPNQRWFSDNRQGFYGPKYYYGVQDGLIMFSNDCRTYPFVRIVFNGLGGVDGETPIIPRFFQRAVVDFVEERWLNAMKLRNPRTYNSMWRDAADRLASHTGNWKKAIKRSSAMDTSEKESMEEYMSSMYHK
jgi:hypothetical protein